MHPRNTESMNICHSCHFQQDQKYSFCGHCGQSFFKQCGYCHQHVPNHFHFCGYCGNSAHHAIHPQAAPAGMPQQFQPSYSVPVQQPTVQYPITPAQPAYTPATSNQAAAQTSQSAPLNPTEQAPVQPKPAQKETAPAAMPQSAVARVSERRPVAVLFCDICGFTAMSEKLDPEEVSNIIQPLFQLCNQAISKYGGVVEKFIGDAIMALFGVPMTHEDDPERAAMAAIEMRQIIQDFGADLEKKMGFGLNMRIGLNVGLVVAGSVDIDAHGGKNYQVMGDVINTAARMEQNAIPGHILVTEEMYLLLKDSFELKADKLIVAKGKKEPLQSYELLGIRQLRQRTRGIGNTKTALIGRTQILSELQKNAEQALAAQTPHSLLIGGDSGFGKTRLVEELRQVLAPQKLRFIQGNATSYSQNFSFFMLQSLVRSMLQVDETSAPNKVIEQISQFLQELKLGNAEMTGRLLECLLYPHLDIPKLKLISPERLQQQIFRAVGDILIQLATDQGVYLHLDDLQWSDQLSLQWLAELQKRVNGTQSRFIVATSARQLDLENTDLIWNWDQELEALSEADSQRLILNILEITADAPLSRNLEALSKAIVSRSAGNPYYIEEVLRNLFESKLLVNQNDSWELTCPIKDLPLPNSVQRLIMSRFDRLPEQERHLLQSLSVIGPNISSELAEAMFDTPDLITHLDSLANSGFIRIHTCQRGKEYVFNQTLAQEVIYNTLVKRRKHLIHQQIGETLEKLHMSDPSQVLDLLAFHFSRTPDLPKAVHYLNLSAEKASRLYANQQANEQYEEILDILQQLEPDSLISVSLNQRDWMKASRLEHHVLHKRCELKLLTGAYDEVLTLVEKAFEKDLTVLEKSRFLYCRGRVLEKRSEFEAAHTVFEEARQLLGDREPQEQARLLNAMGWVSRWMNNYEQALASCQEALKLLEETPDMEQIAYAHNVLGVVYFYQHNWEQSLDHYQQGLKIQKQINDIWGHANSLSNMGNVYFMTNLWPEAIIAFQESLDLRNQLGDLEGLATSHNNLGHAFQELGDYATAEMHIQQALTAYREMNHGVGQAVALCNLGSVCFKQEQEEDALNHFNTGIAMLEAQKMESFLPEAYNHRIQIYLNQSQWQEAQEHLEKNRPSIEKYGDPLQKGRLERLDGYYHLQQKNYEAAESHLNKALEDLQNCDHKAECQLLYQHLSELHQQQNSSQASYWQELASTNQPETQS